MTACGAVLKQRKNKADKRREWERRIKRQYGLTPEDVARQWEQQRGTCALCTQPLASKRWVIDHDHKTGEFRGLLCSWCNHYVLAAIERGGRHRVLNAIWYLWHLGGIVT